MKMFGCKSLRHAVLLWFGLLCSATVNSSAGAQESGAASQSSSSQASASQASSSASSTWSIERDDATWRPSRREVVSIGHDSTLAVGERADTVVSILGSSTSEGEVNRDVVSILGNTRVTGSVGGAVVAILGNTYLNNRVGRDVVAVLGNVELGPQAIVGGQVVAVGGTVIRDPAAVVRGGVQDVSFGSRFVGFDWLQPWIKNCLLYARPLAIAPGLGWAWIVALLSLLSYVFTAWISPRAVDRCVTTLEEYPGYSLLAALLATLATPILFVLLVITVIGILAIPFVGIALLCLGFFGKLVMLAWLGRRFTRSSGSGVLTHAAFATLLGGVIVTALYLMPVVGFLVYKLLGFVGFGVVMYTLILNIKSKRQNGGPRAAPTGPASGEPTSYTQPQQFASDPDVMSHDAMSHETTAGTAAEATASSGLGHAAETSSADHHAASHAASLPRATFWMRMGALLLDLLLVAFILNLVYDSHNILLLGLAVYGALMWKFKGTTIGGILFNLRIVRLDGRELDWATVIVRALSCFLSLIAAGLGFIWIAFDDDKQAWHDKIAGTVVVRTPKGISLV